MLYILGGGYGEPPTEMAHYNYGIHPLLGWIVKSLFTVDSSINWYSIALIAAHYISCTLLLGIIIGRKNTLIAYLSYAVLFIVFEGYFLLYMDFTGASAILAITALLYLLVHTRENNTRYRPYIISTGLFILASFYRLHSILPLVGIALPLFLLTLNRKQILRSAATVLFSGLCILLFNFIHQAWYKAKKPNWSQEEAYRQHLFPFFNEVSTMKYPAEGENWYTEYQLVTKGMIMDTSLVPVSSLKSMYNDLEKEGHIRWNIPAEWWKWFYLNNRLFFAVFIVFFILYGVQRKILLPALAATVLSILGYGFLLLKYKAPPYILISSLYLLCLAVFLYGQEIFILQKKQYKIAAIAVLLLLPAWGILRLFRSSEQNSNYNYLFKERYAEIASHPDQLYIGLETLYAHKYYVFDPPARYPLPNILSGESFLSGHYESVLKRYTITGLKGIFTAPAVLFRGTISKEQKHHFDQVAGRDLKFMEQPGYKHARVWKIAQE